MTTHVEVLQDALNIMNLTLQIIRYFSVVKKKISELGRGRDGGRGREKEKKGESGRKERRRGERKERKESFPSKKKKYFHLYDIVLEFKTFPSPRRGQSGLNTTLPSSDL